MEEELLNDLANKIKSGLYERGQEAKVQSPTLKEYLSHTIEILNNIDLLKSYLEAQRKTIEFLQTE